MLGSVIGFFANFARPRLAVFLISLMPVLELRGGLIAASAFRVPMLQAFLICFLANILPIPIILLFIKRIFRFTREHIILVGAVNWLERKAKAKSGSVLKKQFIGLFLFVAVPLPGTGGWTGALIASLLDMPAGKSFAAIAAGVFCAGIVMIVLTYFIPGLFGFPAAF